MFIFVKIGNTSAKNIIEVRNTKTNTLMMHKEVYSISKNFIIIFAVSQMIEQFSSVQKTMFKFNEKLVNFFAVPQMRVRVKQGL